MSKLKDGGFFFFVLSAVAEILGDSWLATGKNPNASRKL